MNLIERLREEAQDDPDSLYWKAAERIAELEARLDGVAKLPDKWESASRAYFQWQNSNPPPCASQCAAELRKALEQKYE